MKVKELMKRKQGMHETFSDNVSDMDNLHFKLKHKTVEDEFGWIAVNVSNKLVSGALKRGSPSLPLVKEHWMNMRSRPVNEIEEFQTQKELNRKETRGFYEEGQGCRGSLHALVCYKCDKGADF